MSIRILTFNILCDKPRGAPYDWNSRRKPVAELLRKYEPDIVGCRRRPACPVASDGTRNARALWYGSRCAGVFWAWNFLVLCEVELEQSLFVLRAYCSRS